MKAANLSPAELLHYGELGEVDGLDPDVAKQIREAQEEREGQDKDT